MGWWWLPCFLSLGTVRSWGVRATALHKGHLIFLGVHVWRDCWLLTRRNYYWCKKSWWPINYRTYMIYIYLHIYMKYIYIFVYLIYIYETIAAKILHINWWPLDFWTVNVQEMSPYVLIYAVLLGVFFADWTGPPFFPQNIKYKFQEMHEGNDKYNWYNFTPSKN